MKFLVTHQDQGKIKVLQRESESLSSILSYISENNLSGTRVYAEVSEILTAIEQLQAQVRLLSKTHPPTDSKFHQVLPQSEHLDDNQDRVKATILEKTFIPSMPDLGLYSDQINMKIRFANNSSNTIRAIKAKLIFFDLFDAEVFRIGITVNDEIRPNKNFVWEGGFEYNQFVDEHRHFRQFESKDLKLELGDLKIINA